MNEIYLFGEIIHTAGGIGTDQPAEYSEDYFIGVYNKDLNLLILEDCNGETFACYRPHAFFESDTMYFSKVGTL